jgi:transposase
MKSLLYHAFGLKGYRYLATRYEGREIIFEVESEKEPEFKKEGEWVKAGWRWREVRMVSIGFKAVWIRVKVQKWKNSETKKTREQEVEFVSKGATVSRALARQVVELARFMTLEDVSLLVKLSWGTVKEIVKKRLEKDYTRIGYKKVRRVGIDEIYLGKKEKFITLVLDLDSGRIIWVGAGRGVESLRGFWKRLKSAGGHLEAVAMDMSGAYASSVRERAPHAIITFDHFHVVKLMNERLDDLRRELVREAGDKVAKESIKKMRWLLLMSKKNLDESGSIKLQKALDLNRPLAIAYLLKEELSLLWNQTDIQAAKEFLEQWCEKAQASGIAQLQAMVKTLKKHAQGILSYYTTGLTSAVVEGTNRKIKTLLNQAYGLRDQAYLKLRLFALHESKLKFTGV